MLGWVRRLWEWWERYWLRFQAVATPIGSLLVTLQLSRPKPELEEMAAFASLGVLFYTASFAVLETIGVSLMVLALQILKKFERDRSEHDQKLRSEALAQGVAQGLSYAFGYAIVEEAQRQRENTGETLEQAVHRLREKNWQPPDRTTESTELAK